MRNLRYYYRLLAAFLSRFKALIIVGVLLGVALFFIFSFIVPRFMGFNTKRIALTGRFTTDTLPHKVLEKIGMGLTYVNSSGEVKPGIAKSWSTPDKGKTWEFKISDDVFWHDRTQVQSKQISYQFSDADVSFPDEKTVVFTLQNPYSAFPAVVSRPVFKEGLLGTGEWKVKKLKILNGFVNELLLERNKDRIIYKFYPTDENAKLAFELGQVDIVEDLFDASPIDTWPKIKVSKKTDKGEYVAIFFNTADKLLADKTLRQALSYATNKKNLSENRAIGPISDESWAFNSQIKPYSFDPDKARSMINGMNEEVKNNLSITLTVPPLLLKQAESVKTDWESVGVKTQVMVGTGIPGSYQAMMAIFDAPDDPDQYSVWHSTQTQTNITQYSNPRIDKLLEDGRTTVDINLRKQIYLDFQRFLLEDSPAIFLYYPTFTTISRGR